MDPKGTDEQREVDEPEVGSVYSALGKQAWARVDG